MTSVNEEPADIRHFSNLRRPQDQKPNFSHSRPAEKPRMSNTQEFER